MQPDSFELLLDRYHSGDADQHEVGTLEEILRNYPEKRRRFVERALLEVQLYKVFSGILPMNPAARSQASRSRRSRARVVAAAAVFLLTVGALLISSLGQKRPRATEVVAGCVFVDGVGVDHIPDGTPFEVVGDTGAVIDLADGSRAELDRSSKASIQDRRGEGAQIVELAQGGGTFRVAHSGGRFQVETPAGTVIALGTEFSVQLRPPGKNRAGKKTRLALVVAVKAGTVRVEAAGKRSVLSAGKRRVFEDDGEENNRDDGDQNNQDDRDRGHLDGGEQNNPTFPQPVCIQSLFNKGDGSCCP
jgi:ferric-dicitrate binding protein FerR (iron transport regulator)